MKVTNASGVKINVKQLEIGQEIRTNILNMRKSFPAIAEVDQLLILDEEVEINGITKHEAIKSAVAHYDNEADVYIRDIEFTENKYKIVLDLLLGESNPASIEVNATTGEITKERTDQNG